MPKKKEENIIFVKENAVIRIYRSINLTKKRKHKKKKGKKKYVGKIKQKFSKPLKYVALAVEYKVTLQNIVNLKKKKN